MRMIQLAMPLLILLVLMGQDASAASARVLAVFDVEVQGVRLTRATRNKLSRLIAAKLAAFPAYRVVPRSQVKKRLRAGKRESYKACYDQSCQIEIGRELAAEQVVSTQIFKLGSKCTATVQVFDLATAATDRATTETGGCTVDKIVFLLSKALSRLDPTRTNAVKPRPRSSSLSHLPFRSTPAARKRARALLRAAAIRAGGLDRLRAIRTLRLVSSRVKFEIVLPDLMRAHWAPRGKGHPDNAKLLIGAKGYNIPVWSPFPNARPGGLAPQFVIYLRGILWRIPPLVLLNMQAKDLRIEIAKMDRDHVAIRAHPAGIKPVVIVLSTASNRLEKIVWRDSNDNWREDLFSQPKKVSGLVFYQRIGSTTFHTIEVNPPLTRRDLTRKLTSR
jgi:hypothetical protein